MAVVGPSGRASSVRPWYARLAFAAALVAVVVLLAYAGLRSSLALILVSIAGLALVLAGGWWFLSRSGVTRWLGLGLAAAGPVLVLVFFARQRLIWVALLALGLWVVAVAAGQAALSGGAGVGPMPEYETDPPKRPFLIMNPRSGGGKVGRFGLVDAARALGAEVAVLEGPGTVDVAAIARDAVARGADLLGVAGGDGTQALVAGIAAEHGLPFMVISAGTRNHLALDLGLDREDPRNCLNALTDGVELHIDLGLIGDRTFVNNASFGAYAAIVQSPEYRDDKTDTTLRLLPDLLVGQRGPTLVAHAGDRTIRGPQALLVSNNAYETNDFAGLGRRSRLDGDALGVIGVHVTSAVQAAGLMRGNRSRSVTMLATDTLVVDADVPSVPVGIDGESVLMPTPVTCSIRPKALRVRVPRDRPGVPVPKPAVDWRQLGRLALNRTDPVSTAQPALPGPDARR